MALVVSIVSAIVVASGGAELVGERWLVIILVPLCLLSVIGHFLSIMASRRLS